MDEAPCWEKGDECWCKTHVCDIGMLSPTGNLCGCIPFGTAAPLRSNAGKNDSSGITLNLLPSPLQLEKNRLASLFSRHSSQGAGACKNGWLLVKCLKV